MFQGHAVDAVIMPVAPHAAVIPGKFYHTGESWMCSRVTWETTLNGNTGYTEAMNLMNYSVAVIPVTQADKKVDVFDDSYEPLGNEDRLNWQSCKHSIHINWAFGVT